MAWPLASQFSAMLQKPQIAFRDPELMWLEIERDQFRQPRPWAGSFAVVYKGTNPATGVSRAIRVFTTESPERRGRYDAISEYLRQHCPQCLVPFEYRDASIRAVGFSDWFPVILMEWVQGETLFRWVRAQCGQGNGAALALAAEHWLEVVGELEEAKVAHGDLQHANVMITTEGRLKLVDYDGMCVPALVGRRNLEVGVEPYQHPSRNEKTALSLELDRFSAAVIYTALRALAADPSLWQRHVEASQYDKLLLRKEDFASPQSSALAADLRKSPDPEVQDLWERLLVLRKAPAERIPPLKQVAAPSFEKIEELLKAKQWLMAVEMLNRRGKFKDAPEQLRPLIRKAYEQVCRGEAWEQVRQVLQEISETGDRALIAAWNESALAGFQPAERARPQLDGARKRLAVLDRIQTLIQQADAKYTVGNEQALAAAGKELTAQYRYQNESRIERARRTIKAIRRLRNAMKEPAQESAIVAAAEEVKGVGCDPLVPATWRPRIEIAQKRLPIMQLLQRLPANGPLDQFDRQVMAIWHEGLMAGCVEAENWRALYQEAVRRQQVVMELFAAIRDHRESDIVQLAGEPCLERYPLPTGWTTTIESVRQRETQIQSMLKALETGDCVGFLRTFDARLIAYRAHEFVPFDEQICRWAMSDILPLRRVGLGPAVGRDSIVPCEDEEYAFRLRWTWPPPRFTDQCLLVLCKSEPGPEMDPCQAPAFERIPIDRLSWESGGGSRLFRVRQEWMGGYLTVWAMLNLGFRLLWSEPLVLGRLDAMAGAGHGWKGWFHLSGSGQKAEETTKKSVG